MNIAEDIFARHSINGEARVLSGGWTNEVWASGGAVLRLSKQPGSEKLRGEAALAAMLPKEVGYPEIIDTGVEDGMEWVLCREIQGMDLEKAWPDLSDAEQLSAVSQMKNMADLIHGVNVSAVAAKLNKNPWYMAGGVQDALDTLETIASRGVYANGQAERVRCLIANFQTALAGAERVLVHGDLTRANVMWNAGRVVSVLDFENALYAPVEVDTLCILNESASLTGGFPRIDRADPLLYGYAVIKAQRHLAMEMEYGTPDITKTEEFAQLSALL